MNIFYNITRHDEGAIILDKPECRKILHQFKNEILRVKFDFMIRKDTYKELCFITDMLIILSEYSGNMCNEYDMIRYNLLPTITIAFKSFIFKYNDVDVVDLLIILMKLFNDDNIVNYVLEKYKISAFFVDFVKGISILIGENDLATWNEDKMSLSLIVLVNILWSISFQDQYKNDLIQNIDIYKTLETQNFSNTLTSRHIFSLKRSIDGIYQNLYPSIIPNINETLQSLTISCSYIDMDFARKLYDVLSKTLKLSICIDSENWKQIAQTIQQSDMVLFLITKDFFNNKSCRQELIYVTDILKKPFVPIFIDSDYQSISWLHQRIDSIKSIRFGKEEDFLNTCEELLSTIMNISPVKSSLNDKEVKQWFSENNIMPRNYMNFINFRICMN